MRDHQVIGRSETGYYYTVPPCFQSYTFRAEPMNEDRYFEDLTVYTHQISPFVLDGVFNVGWIDPRSKFPVGEVPYEFVDRLVEIAGSTGAFNALVEPIRELPRCDVCGEIEIPNSQGALIPSAELWIPASQKIYAAPVTILHMVQIHSYQPPQEYVKAVLASANDIAFNAGTVYRQKLKDSDWFKNRSFGIPY